MSATTRQVAIVGGGIVGRTAAWWLQQRGHSVTLIDAADPDGGSAAALGLLMAQVFHRASGRAWRMRQTSLALWDAWTTILRQRGHALERRRGLLFVASNAEDLARQQALCQARQAMGLPLELWDRQRIAALQPALPETGRGGLWSAADGQIDPLPLLLALQHEAQQQGCRILGTRVLSLEREPAGGWRLHLGNGDSLRSPVVVISAGHNSASLLEPLGLNLPMQPVLGQAIELQIDDPAAAIWRDHWPAAVVWQGINLVPRSDGRLWLGATLEPGGQADARALERMASLNGHAPPWLRSAAVVRQWQGLRAQPVGRGAPWLERLEPGLLLASCHYRNGLLLAPATALWITAELETGAGGQEQS